MVVVMWCGVGLDQATVIPVITGWVTIQRWQNRMANLGHYYTVMSNRKRLPVRILVKERVL